MCAFARLGQLAIFLAALGITGLADSRPSWFVQDYRSPSEWGFFCTSSGNSENEALKAARAECSGKICQLFGVEVDATTKTSETLKDISVVSQIIERCPNVRVTGRKEKKKTVSCEEGKCEAYVLQIYPRTEYDKEYARLNQPAISKVLEKTIIIREGNETFRDPAKCRGHLGTYSLIRGEDPPEMKSRVDELKSAEADCAQLDYRNNELQEELRTYLIKALQFRSLAVSLALNRELQAHAKLTEKIAGFRMFEERQLQNLALRPKLEKRIKENYDSLFARNNFLAADQVWLLSNGKKVTRNPYLDELLTCEAHARLVMAWPADLSGDLTVCVPGVNQPGNDCQTLNVVTLRAQFAGCNCQAAGVTDPQDCTRVLMQIIDEKCPGEVTPECYSRLAQTTNQRLKVELRRPNESKAH